MTILSLKDVDVKGKRVLVREDFNVPMQNGQISSDARLLAAIPTIELLWQSDAKIILMSHFGRPLEGQFDSANSLAPVAMRLATLLGKPVRLVNSINDAKHGLTQEIILLENTRFFMGEESNDPTLSKQLADLCDIFVMDAFASAHRKHASTYGVAKFAPMSVAGPLLLHEIEAVERILKHPKRPLVAIVGGSKISSKLGLLEALLQQVDTLIVGGGIANTLLAAKGFSIGKSLVELDLLDTAKSLLALGGSKLPLPVDVRCAKAFNQNEKCQKKSVNAISDDDLILDIGSKTSDLYREIILNAGTILWNGPVGVFEFPEFRAGTQTIANAIANSHAFSVAGGGDTISAIELFDVQDKISYISTGGGAFLTYLELGTLPAIEALTCT